jgi:hypothetical protein
MPAEELLCVACVISTVQACTGGLDLEVQAGQSSGQVLLWVAAAAESASL